MDMFYWTHGSTISLCCYPVCFSIHPTDMDAPANLKATDVTVDSAVLTWVPPLAHIEGYILTYSAEDDNMEVRLSHQVWDTFLHQNKELLTRYSNSYSFIFAFISYTAIFNVIIRCADFVILNILSWKPRSDFFVQHQTKTILWPYVNMLDKQFLCCLKVEAQMKFCETLTSCGQRIKLIDTKGFQTQTQGIFLFIYLDYIIYNITRNSSMTSWFLFS